MPVEAFITRVNNGLCHGLTAVAAHGLVAAFHGDTERQSSRYRQAAMEAGRLRICCGGGGRRVCSGFGGGHVSNLKTGVVSGRRQQAVAARSIAYCPQQGLYCKWFFTIS